MATKSKKTVAKKKAPAKPRVRKSKKSAEAAVAQLADKAILVEDLSPAPTFIQRLRNWFNDVGKVMEETN